MPDLIIGGNTYQNIDHIRIKKSNGTMATFVEPNKIDEMFAAKFNVMQLRGVIDGKTILLSKSNIAFETSLDKIVLMEG